MPLQPIPTPTPEEDRRNALLEQLLAGAIGGDEEARNQLLETLLPRLRDQVRQWLNVRCRNEQSDVLCSVVRKVIEQPALPATLPHFLGWVGVVVRNRCHDEWRRRVSQPAPLGDHDPQASSSEGRETSRSPGMGRLQLLPEHYRQILEDTFYDGMSAEQIGERMSLSAGNVRVLRHRALKQLRQLMENYHEDQ